MILTKLLSLLIGVGLSISGSAILAKTIIKSIEDINNISGEYWGWNPHLREALKQDRKNGIIGLSLLIPGVILQGIYVIMEITINIKN